MVLNTKISVIMPSFNCEEYIDKSIESVLHQSYKNFELIICDDGSTDSTSTIIDEYLSKDNRIKKVKNFFGSGAASARNSCLSIADGDYITFLDSDDIWLENKLSNQVNYMRVEDISLSHGDYYIFENDVKTINGLFEAKKAITYSDLLRSCDIGCLTVMMKRDDYKSFRFPESPKEDFAAWLTLAKKGGVFHKYPNVDSLYRVGKKSLSSNKLSEIKKQYLVLKNCSKESNLNVFLYTVSYCFKGILKHYYLYRKH